MRNRVFAVLCGAALFVACATAARTIEASQSQAVILRTELESDPFPNLYEAIRSLRPLWVGSRLGGVYVDDTEKNVDWLRDASVVLVERVELVSADMASARWGTRNLASHFIHVIRRR
ncbi:hypothetical protein ACFL3B_03700 [Gemmatimonadota bacterium]